MSGVTSRFGDVVCAAAFVDSGETGVRRVVLGTIVLAANTLSCPSDVTRGVQAAFDTAAFVSSSYGGTLFYSATQSPDPVDATAKVAAATFLTLVVPPVLRLVGYGVVNEIEELRDLRGQ